MDSSRMEEPFVNFLPEPSDALINMLRHVANEQGNIAEFRVELSSLEAPSARLAIELYQIEHYGQSNLSVEVGLIQQPDPRIPQKPVDFVLWEYSGTDPRPALAEPPEEVGMQIGAIARTPYSPRAWSEQARKLARSLGVGRKMEILAVMIHPPSTQEAFSVWDWLQRVQIAAGYVISYLDQGWENSVRKRCLFSLARGPMDWTNQAAILPLCYIAQTEPPTAMSIGELYYELLESLPEPGGVPYSFALLFCIGQILDLLHGHCEPPWHGVFMKKWIQIEPDDRCNPSVKCSRAIVKDRSFPMLRWESAPHPEERVSALRRLSGRYFRSRQGIAPGMSTWRWFRILIPGGRQARIRLGFWGLNH